MAEVKGNLFLIFPMMPGPGPIIGVVLGSGREGLQTDEHGYCRIVDPFWYLEMPDKNQRIQSPDNQAQGLQLGMMPISKVLGSEPMSVLPGGFIGPIASSALIKLYEQACNQLRAARAGIQLVKG